METLGKSLERYTNGGAKFAFWSIIVIIVFLIGFFCFADIEMDQGGLMGLIFGIVVFSCIGVYMFFKAKTEVDLREHGIYVRNVGKEHGVLYSDIAKLDKVRRVGKSGHTVIVFYLLVIETKDGERITFVGYFSFIKKNESTSC